MDPDELVALQEESSELSLYYLLTYSNKKKSLNPFGGKIFPVSMAE